MDNRSLLIVDDEPNVINSLKRVLRHEGYTLFSANSGKEGLDLLKRNDIGVVLSDVMMPEMDGYECCKHLKENSETEDIPIIFLTAKKFFINFINQFFNFVNFYNFSKWVFYPRKVGILSEKSGYFIREKWV